MSEKKVYEFRSRVVVDPAGEANKQGSTLRSGKRRQWWQFKSEDEAVAFGNRRANHACETTIAFAAVAYVNRKEKSSDGVNLQTRPG